MPFSYTKPIFFMFGTFSNNLSVLRKFLMVMLSLVIVLLLFSKRLIF